MQLTITQSDFEEAVTDYLAKMGISASADDITFSSTSGKAIKGIMATIEFSPGMDKPKTPAKETTATAPV